MYMQYIYQVYSVRNKMLYNSKQRGDLDIYSTL